MPLPFSELATVCTFFFALRCLKPLHIQPEIALTSLRPSRRRLATRPPRRSRAPGRRRLCFPGFSRCSLCRWLRFSLRESASHFFSGLNSTWLFISLPRRLTSTEQEAGGRGAGAESTSGPGRGTSQLLRPSVPSSVSLVPRPRGKHFIGLRYFCLYIFCLFVLFFLSFPSLLLLLFFLLNLSAVHPRLHAKESG